MCGNNTGCTLSPSSPHEDPHCSTSYLPLPGVQLVTKNSLLHYITSTHCTWRRGKKRVPLLPASAYEADTACQSLQKANRQSPWRIRSRENETSDGDRFRFRLYCLLIFSTLQEHVAPTALCLLPGILPQSPSRHPSCFAHHVPARLEGPLPRSII